MLQGACAVDTFYFDIEIDDECICMYTRLVNEYGFVHYVFEFFFKTKFHAYKDMSVLIVEIALLFISFGLKSDS